jgi:hypothetical protein
MKVKIKERGYWNMVGKGRVAGVPKTFGRPRRTRPPKGGLL